MLVGVVLIPYERTCIEVLACVVLIPYERTRIEVLAGVCCITGLACWCNTDTLRTYFYRSTCFITGSYLLMLGSCALGW